MIRTTAGVLLCIALSSPAAAQTALPKEGSVELTTTFQATFQAIVLDKEFVQSFYDAYGSALAAKEGGLGDRMTARCLGSARFVKGKFDGEFGGCEYTDRSGDKYYISYSASGTDTPGHTISKGTWVGGTGKYAGITGNCDGKRYALPSPGAGRGASLVLSKCTYKLP